MEENKVTLAQVAYQISRDTDFAARMRIDSDAALAEKGLELSKEEQAFLSSGLNGDSQERINIADIVLKMRGGWR